MSFEARCPQCMFLSRQLGQPTPCLLHVALPGEAEADVDAPTEPGGPESLDYDEPYTFGQLRPTVDRPGPFSLREYVRLLLLRSRVQEQRSALDAPAAPAQALDAPAAPAQAQGAPAAPTQARSLSRR